MRVLLVEDDSVLGQGLSESLGLEGHAVDWVDDGADAMSALAHDNFDGIILDLALPTHSGLEILSAWRTEGETVPVLILTADDAIERCIEALNAGADDVVTKPITVDELQARLHALVRRTQGKCHNQLAYGPITLERGDRHVTISGRPVAISAFELSVLEALLERPGHVVPKRTLEERLYGWSDGPESNSLEVLIHKLRGKLGRERIETVRGLGYRLAG